MNPLVARMMGKTLREEASTPIPAIRQSQPARSRLNRHRRVSAAMLGLGEADDSEAIIPDDAEPIDDVAGPSGIKLDQAKVDQDRKPDEPDSPVTPDEDAEQLMTPRDALVAPDVTPQAFDPIDPGDVPAPAEPAPAPAAAAPAPAPAPPPASPNRVNPMDVLLGRVSPNGKPTKPVPEEPAVTAEAAQATVNTVLGVNGGGDSLLKQGQAMPDPTPAQPAKIMETFYKYGPKPTLNF